MKFAHAVRTEAESNPPLNDVYSFYKILKKQLNQLEETSKTSCYDQDGDDPSRKRDGEDSLVRAEEEQFCQHLRLGLDVQISKLWSREEDCIIQLEELDRLVREAEAATTREQVDVLCQQLVNFHGVLVLSTHWAWLVVVAKDKILKKHLKRTGRPIYVPSSDVLDELELPDKTYENFTTYVRRVEADLQAVVSRLRTFGEDITMPMSQQITAPELLLYSGSSSDSDDGGAGEQAEHENEANRASSASSECTGMNQTWTDKWEQNNKIMLQTKAAMATWDKLKKDAKSPSSASSIYPEAKRPRSQASGTA